LFCAIDFGKLFSPSLDFSSFHTARVIRVGLTMCRSIPVLTYEPTSAAPVGMPAQLEMKEAANRGGLSVFCSLRSII
jgi:hypothetical protein